MIEEMQRALDAARAELHTRGEALEATNTRVQEAKPDETEARVAEHTAAATAFDEQADEVERLRTNLDDAKRRAKVLEDNPIEERAAAGARVEITHEPRMYSSESNLEEHRSFFSDLYRHQKMGDSSARERLERHGKQVEEDLALLKREKGHQFRDVGTGAFAGLTVPQYLVDEFAPLARAGAPTVNLVAQKSQLPSQGMTLNIGRMTTGTAVAVQASENTGAQETDADDTLLTINVRTYSGQQDVSRQAMERSTGVDTEIYRDLVNAYFAKLDNGIINDDGTSGTHLGIRSTSGIVAVTYTDASPTVPELYPKVADAIRQINGGTFKLAPATTIIMHSRRWGWGTAALDSQNRPLFIPDANGPFNAIAVGEAAGYGQVMGKLQGLPTITDDNIPTNLGGGTEDVGLVVSGFNLRLWWEGDGMPRQFTFEQSNAPQSVRLAVWGYSAFTAGKYPLGSATIGGTGFAAPTF